MTAPASMTESITDVTRWVLGTDPLEVPSVDRAARHLLLDTLGCTIAGLDKPELVELERGLARFDEGSIRMVGMQRSLSVTAAAYLLGMAATWDEACEGLARAHGRPGLHAFPVAVVLTLATGGTLGDALRALVRGYEVGGRLGERLRIRPGMHVDGTWGTFAGVMAAGSVLGLDADHTMRAIEAGACQTPFSLYHPVKQGATIRNSYVAEAGSRAIRLALAVEAGVTTPHGSLELYDELALAGTAQDEIAPPGEWLVEQGYLKPFAAVRHVHYGAEAARLWHGQHRGQADQIESLVLEVYPEAVVYCANRAPDTAIQAQFSLTYGVARMLLHGDLGPDAYSDEALADPEVRRLERLVEVRTASGERSHERRAGLRVGTACGPESMMVVDSVTGDLDHPMARTELVEKFRRYTGSRLKLGPRTSMPLVDAILDGPADQPLVSILAER